MSDIPFRARLLARRIFPNRTWYPIEAHDDPRYGEVLEGMRPTPEELEAQRIAALDCQGPVFSIVVPLFETPREYLADMAESVLAQTYPHFELILVNASPELPDLRTWVEKYAVDDPRVKHVMLDDNHGITENTNFGIAQATGDFICFMDHDDWIEPDTLFEYAAALREHDDIDLLYCDEDLVEKEKGSWKHRHPFFKPDYSPELLLCKNYIVHLLAVRKSVVDELPTPGSEFDGTQDYNMTFMVAERARRVHHVAKVLYHWRVGAESTAANPAAKPYGKRAYRLSVTRHLEREGIRGGIVGSGITNIHTIWFKPETLPKVSLVVACPDRLEDASFSAFATTFWQTSMYDNVEILLVGPDGNSDGRTAPAGELAGTRAIACDPETSLLARFNAGALEATGEVLVFMDAGCGFSTPEPLEQLVGLLSIKGVGVVGPKALFSDYTVKAYGVGVSGMGVMPLYRGYPLDHASYQCNTRAFQNTSAVGYQGLAIKRGAFSALGGFDEAFTGEIGAVDLCRRTTEAGGRVVATCAVELLTADQAPLMSFDGTDEYPDYPAAEIERLFAKHPALRESTDPFRSPHLNLRSGYPLLRHARFSL